MLLQSYKELRNFSIEKIESLFPKEKNRKSILFAVEIFLLRAADVGYLTLYNFEEANLLLFTTFRKNLRFGEAERAHIQ